MVTGDGKARASLQARPEEGCWVRLDPSWNIPAYSLSVIISRTPDTSLMLMAPASIHKAPHAL